MIDEWDTAVHWQVATMTGNRPNSEGMRLHNPAGLVNRIACTDINHFLEQFRGENCDL